MFFLLDIATCERKGLATRLDQVNFKVGLWKHFRSLKQTIEQLHLCNWFLSPLLCHHLEQRCPLCDSHSRWPSPLQSQIFWSVSPAKAAIGYVFLKYWLRSATDYKCQYFYFTDLAAISLDIPARKFGQRSWILFFCGNLIFKELGEVLISWREG